MKAVAAVVAAAVAGSLALAACGGGTPSRPIESPPGTTGRTSVSTPTPSPTTSAPVPSSTSTSSTTTTSTRPSTTAPSTTTSTSSGIPAALRGVDVEVIPTSRRVVALTFDGGSSDAGLASVLATLRDAGIKASFFLTGDFVRRYPTQTRRIAAAGHRIGNHSDRHRDVTTLTNAEIRADLARAEAAIREAAGVTPRPLFRFPFGARTSADIRVVNDAGYVAVRWTVDTLGWKGTSGGATVTSVRQRALDAARAGEIVLMHVGANPDDGTTLDADALASIIDGLRDKGYGFVTLDALLR